MNEPHEKVRAASGKPRAMAAIRAKCADCMGFYADGRKDCECRDCPLYAFNRYAQQEPDYEWTRYIPSRPGRVTWEEAAPQLTEEQKRANAERLRRGREKRMTAD